MESGRLPDAPAERDSDNEPEEEHGDRGEPRADLSKVYVGKTFAWTHAKGEDSDQAHDLKRLDEEEGVFFNGKEADTSEEAFVGKIPDALFHGKIVPRAGEEHDHEEKEQAWQQDLGAPERLVGPEAKNQEKGKIEEKVKSEISHVSLNHSITG